MSPIQGLKKASQSLQHFGVAGTGTVGTVGTSGTGETLGTGIVK
jgi:hypothetical protein